MVVLEVETQLCKPESYKFFLTYFCKDKPCTYDRFLYVWRNMLRICNPQDMSHYWQQYDHDDLGEDMALLILEYV